MMSRHDAELLILAERVETVEDFALGISSRLAMLADTVKSLRQEMYGEDRGEVTYSPDLKSGTH